MVYLVVVTVLAVNSNLVDMINMWRAPFKRHHHLANATHVLQPLFSVWQLNVPKQNFSNQW